LDQDHGRLDTKYVDGSVWKYFGLKEKHHESIVSMSDQWSYEFYGLKDGYYRISLIDLPWTPSHSKITKLISIGDNYFVAYVDNYIGSEIQETMRAIIRKVTEDGQSRYVLIEYLVYKMNPDYFRADPVTIDEMGEAYTSFFGLHIEDSTINECISKFGDTKIIGSGDAATSSTRINYYFKDENSFVTFNSGEMGGGENITDVTVSNQCKEKYRVISNYKFSNSDFGNLRLGLKKSVIVHSFESLEWNDKMGEVWYGKKNTDDSR
jgi:hypothetical protein